LLVVLFSKHGKIKLRKDHGERKFNVLTWFVLVFSCGIGMLWGVQVTKSSQSGSVSPDFCSREVLPALSLAPVMHRERARKVIS
jgi:hypothetical protein